MSKRKNTQSDRRLFAMRYFMDKGLSPHAAAGLVGNLYRESRLNPDSLNSSSNALGIAQWLGDRRTNLISTYGNAPTLLQQLDFIWHELNTTHKKGLLTLLNSKDATEAARNAMGYYEFSAGPDGAIRAMNKSGQNGQRSMDEGIAFANEIYNMYAPPVVTVANEPVLQSLPTPTVRPPRRTVKQVNKVLPEITVYGNRPVNTPRIAPTRQQSRKTFNDYFNYEMLKSAGMIDEDADFTNIFLLNGLNKPKYKGGKDASSQSDELPVRWNTTGGAGYISPSLSQDFIDNFFYKVSSKIMQMGRGVSSKTKVGKNLEPMEGVALGTYLLPRSILDRIFKKYGYTRVDGDYGLVKKAVGNKDIPVYQRNPDSITRDKLHVIGNPPSGSWFGTNDTGLVHAGNFPSAVYHDDEGNLYQKAWDLNDYGGSDGAAKHYSTIKRLKADFVDAIGSPTVVTTGFQPIVNRDGSRATLLHAGNVHSDLNPLIDNYLESKGLVRYPATIATYEELERGVPVIFPGFIGLPEVVVTGKNIDYDIR